MTKPHFTFLEWHWTTAKENLFLADPEQLRIYRILVKLIS